MLVGRVALSRVTSTYYKVCYNSPTFLSYRISDITVSDHGMVGSALFITVGNTHISKRDFVPRIVRTNTLYSLSRRSLNSISCPCVHISSYARTLGSLTRRCHHSLSVGIMNVAKDIKGADAGRVVTSMLSRGCGMLGARKGFGGRVKLPLAMFGVHRRRRITILRVKVDRFKSVGPLTGVTHPSIYIVAGVKCTRLRGLKAESKVLGRGDSVASCVGPGNSIVFGKSSSGLGDCASHSKEAPICFNLASSYPFRIRGVRHGKLGKACTRFIAPASHFRTRVSVPKSRVVCGTLTKITIKCTLNVGGSRVTHKVRGLIPVTKHGGLVRTGRCAVVSSYCGTGPTSVGSSLSMLTCTSAEGITVLNSVNRLNTSRLTVRHRIKTCTAFGGASILIYVKTLSGSVTRTTGRAILTARGGVGIFRFSAGRSFCRGVKRVLGRGSAVLIGTSRFVRFPRVIGGLSRRTWTRAALGVWIDLGGRLGLLSKPFCYPKRTEFGSFFLALILSSVPFSCSVPDTFPAV